MRKLLIGLGLLIVAVGSSLAGADYPGEKFTSVMGFDLVKNTLEDIQGRLGKTTEMKSGDAASSQKKICYALSNPNQTVEFSKGEVSAGFIIRQPIASDKTQCRSINAQSPVGVEGVKLGISLADFKKIVGSPTKEKSNWVRYEFTRKHRLSDDEVLEIAKKNHGDQATLADGEDFRNSDVQIFIEGKFSRGKLSTFSVLKTETF